MEQELTTLDEQMKCEIQSIKDKYTSIKKEVKSKYKKIEQDANKEKKRVEKEEQKKLRKSIPKSLKNLVWNKHIGKEKGIGECNVCKNEIDSKNFECGHIISVKDNGETNESNLLPICGPCNKSMGTQNLNEFKDKYFKKSHVNTTDTKVDDTTVDDTTVDNTKVDDTKPDETYVDKYIQRNLYHTDETKPVKHNGIVIHILGEQPLFLSMDDIFHNYREWLSKYYNESYNETQYEQCFGESKDRNELLTKLTLIYGELTKNPHSLENGFGIDNFITKKGYGFTHIKFN
jgi:5-methylcytosine-specific restriction endonuclease McrA